MASVVLRGESTGSPRYFVADVASAAKRDLKPGEILDGEGGFTVYGRLVQAKESLGGKYLPLGLSNKAKMIREVPKDTILTYRDVRLDAGLFSYKIRRMLEENT